MNNAMKTLEKAVATCYNVKVKNVTIGYIENNAKSVLVKVDMSSCKSPIVCTNGFMVNDKFENGVLTFEFMKSDLYDFLIFVD